MVDLTHRCKRLVFAFYSNTTDFITTIKLTENCVYGVKDCCHNAQLQDHLFLVWKALFQYKAVLTLMWTEQLHFSEGPV